MAGLTARYLDSLKANGRRQEIADDIVRGLSMRVTAAGAKSWALRYRNQSGQQRRLTLGAYPALPLSKARDEAIKALGAVAVERDPAQDKQRERRKARVDRAEKPQTLKQLWTLYNDHELQGKAESTQDYYLWLWTKHLEPRLGEDDLVTLDRAAVRVALRQIGKTAPTTANRALSLLRRMLNVAVDNEYLPASALARMGSLFDETSRDRVLNDLEIQALWKAFEIAPWRNDIPVSERLVIALKLVLLTLARPGEVAGLDASEIDPVVRTWTVPPTRTKNGRPHVVPLSPAAWKLLQKAFGSNNSEEWDGPAFTNSRNKSKPIERRSLTRAMTRVRAHARLEGEEEPIPRATPHDLRRTGSTYIASERIGAAPHIVGAILSHTPEGPAVTSIYNRHKYIVEKRAALEAWAKLLSEIVEAKKRSNNVARPKKKRQVRQ